MNGKPRQTAGPEVVFRVGGGDDPNRLRDARALVQIPGVRALHPVFPRPGAASRAFAAAPELSTYYRVACDDTAAVDLAGVVAQLNAIDAVTDAWLRPRLQLTGLPAQEVGAVNSTPDEQPSGHTPDFYTDMHQRYLRPAAEGGIDAYAAWKLHGGTGTAIRVIDVEREWCPTHEDMQLDHFVLEGDPTGDKLDRNHGTSVLGILAGRHDARGIRGLCPDATINGVSIEGDAQRSVARAIYQAANWLGHGDIMLLEMQGPGPDADLNSESQKGWVPVEFWPAERAAIRYAVDRGVIVVAAAGNGGVDLDALARPRGDGRANPPAARDADSGAILVGAGAPPADVFPEKEYGPDRSRLEFSNYGRAVDVQAWGHEVATTGGLGETWDDLYPGPDENRWYTSRFSGTSSAAAIVAGGLACVQGALRANRRRLLEPLEARDLIRSLDCVQQDAPGRPSTQRIGPSLDLAQLIDQAMSRRNVPRGSPGPVTGSNLSTRSEQMSQPTTVYNVYVGGGAPGAAETSQFRTLLLTAAQVDMTQVKGPAIVLPIGGGYLFVDLTPTAGAPAVDVSRLATGTSQTLPVDKVDVTQVKGPSVIVPTGDGRVDVRELTPGG